ncbi:hypothetical protein J7E38_09710 [Bacillus sp. ISL-35]|uniref:hypothetical protein n=1 Tax=Bacillus sp. ISL-35 TaxID=2819122 RepID=UPI001BE76057|nr:hypothetical protein [Bacillus sp. ISL-35]MBT2679279.1 hypothetical protein [Bacillus sp. ISL-35]MBT2703175.1 hypothetical protein [Chryseobacterium sp. ISL-80]
MENQCCKCNKVILEKDLIKTDEFKKFGSEVKNYCPDCFLLYVKNGFGNYNIGNCEVCNTPLVLQYDEEETLLLAREDFTVHFICRKVRDAEANNDETEIEQLDKEEHDWFVVYTIEPDPKDLEFGY